MFINHGTANKTMEYCVALKNNETDHYLFNSNSIHHTLLSKKYANFRVKVASCRVKKNKCFRVKDLYSSSIKTYLYSIYGCMNTLHI